MKSWLEKNNGGMYSTYNEVKSVVAERLARTLKNEIYKYMTSISRNVYVDQLDEIVNEYNNTYHRTIKLKPVDVKDDTYINIGKEINDKDPNIKIGYLVRITKYKNIFVKTILQIVLKRFLLSVKLKKTVPWTYVISDLNGEEVIRAFYKKELQKTIQKEFRKKEIRK